MSGNAVPPDHMVESMSNALRDIGIHPGRPGVRGELATRLLKEGMKLDQLDYLWQKHMERASEDHSALRLMAAALSKPNQWRLFISDFELIDKKRAEQRERQQPTPQVNMVPEEEYHRSEAECLGLTMAEYRTWRYERMLCCRVFGDRAPREVVAEEAGMTLEELEAALERHPDVLPDARAMEKSGKRKHAREMVAAMRKKARKEAAAL